MGRSLWIWHRRLGLILLLPLLWWVGTGLVFSLWAIEHVRGNTYSTEESAKGGELPAEPILPPSWIHEYTRVQLRSVEGVAVAIGENENSTQLVDLSDGRVLGKVIPSSWAIAAAIRDFAPEAPVSETWLYDREGRGTRVASSTQPGASSASAGSVGVQAESGTTPAGSSGAPAESGHAPTSSGGVQAESGKAPTSSGNRRDVPSEYAGPLPAYAVHFDHGSGMRIYIDALTGEIRSRRTSVWRFYDWAFRLHALDIVSDELKRSIMIMIVMLWLAIGTTGLVMWSKIFNVRRARVSRPR